MNEEWERWLREADPGWIEIDGQELVVRDTFVSGKGSALSVRYFRTEAPGVRAKVIFGPGTQGPPGCAHGGSMAALLDEVLGCAVWCHGRLAVSAELHVHYRRLLPIPQRCIAEARVERTDGRKVWARARLRDVSGEILFAAGEGVFLGLDSTPERLHSATGQLSRYTGRPQIEDGGRDPQ